jgi:hypothetical protein
MTSTECKLLELVDEHQTQYRRSWIGLLTEPNKEGYAARWLIRISDKSPTQVYWPKKIEQVATKRPLGNGRLGRMPAVRPVIHGMIFASIALDRIDGYDPFQEFGATPGIRGWLRKRDAHGGVRYISEAEMKEIKDMEARANKIEAPTGPHQFKLGDRVKLTDGLMSMWGIGVIKRLNSNDSLDVEFKLFGGMTKTTVGPQQVEAV